ncbi:MAG: hypothetical protein K2Q06_06500 [Parvularculaceae bacterium]|nr:hypothetical protein [Parvularculaceae bacterium]
MSSFLDVAMIAAEETGGAAEKGGLPQMDVSTFPSQLFWLAVSFGFLYFVVSVLVLPGLGGAIAARRGKIAGDLDNAATLKVEAEKAEKSYAAALADAKAKARALGGEAREKLDAEFAAMQKDADARAAAALAAAEERIGAMKKNAATKVREAASDTTRSIVETLIDETPAPDQVSAAVARAVQEAV